MSPTRQSSSNRVFSPPPSRRLPSSHFHESSRSSSAGKPYPHSYFDICTLFQDNRCTNRSRAHTKLHVCMLCDSDAHSLCDCVHASKQKLVCCLFWNRGWCKNRPCSKKHFCIKCDSPHHGANNCHTVV
ncbi:hypothetical protein BCR33DRAFT_846936 [Rhizoclosmatium globosum]|uniref:C3H1-type domain-containing protein n=1 Tax=Rhizoclosmatium globosum TaxID=329046 RepID=A0A1Y2CU06_9FUNG|nr:hypothetical protein BCR33DRAFT_846936 [Rhizoclosmatium globosum]|eukprot:ORY50472.1 hypothetical protein BCR33DRAFT_846936 [Rhizoclosmatium globosum]